MPSCSHKEENLANFQKLKMRLLKEQKTEQDHFSIKKKMTQKEQNLYIEDQQSLIMGQFIKDNGLEMVLDMEGGFSCGLMDQNMKEFG